MTAEAPVLALRGVSYRYPGYRRRAIDGIDLSLSSGEIVGVVGPNDAGKSTLCLVAAGLAPGSIGGELGGNVSLGGGAGTGTAGIVFANPASQLSGTACTVFEEVAFGPVNLGLPVAETVARARAALAALGIDDLAERSPARLSGGQTQLVAIAAMLAMRPDVLVLDEPVAELDPDGQRRVGEALRSIAVAGTAILVAEHDLDLLASMCTRLVALDEGRLVFDLPITAALADPRLADLGVRRPARLGAHP
jgi:energy-coupling factor transporter ATP-binding protein EcfA2